MKLNKTDLKLLKNILWKQLLLTLATITQIFTNSTAWNVVIENQMPCWSDIN
jgi:hypothetical protein